MKLFSNIILFIIFQYVFFLVHAFCQTPPGIQWQTNLGGSNLDFGSSITQCYDGGYIVAGQSYSNDFDVTNNHGFADYWIVKLNTIGTVEWQKSLGGSNNDIAYSVIQTTDSGFVVAGSSSSNDGDLTQNYGGDDYWVVKLDNAGNLQWQKSYGGTQEDVAYSIVQTTDGGFFIAGFSISNDSIVTGNHGSYDFWVIKSDDNGTMQWQKSIGGSLLDQAFSCHQTMDGGYIVTGGSKSSDGDATINHGDTDCWVVKLDSAGNIQWQRSYGGTNTDQANSIYQNTDGNFIVAGLTYSNDGDVTGNHGIFDDWIIKLDTVGNLQWQKALGGSGYDGAACIKQTADNGYIISGGSDSNNGDVTNNHGNGDFWILKLDSNGVILWQKCLGGTNSDNSYSITQTTDGGYAIAGQTQSDNGDVTANYGIIDYWIVKLFPDTITFVQNYQMQTANFQISPNPCTGTFQILFPKSDQNSNYTLEIYSILGQNVFQSNHTPANSLLPTKMDVSFLSKGIYVLKINDGVSVSSSKLIIEHD